MSNKKHRFKSQYFNLWSLQAAIACLCVWIFSKPAPAASPAAARFYELTPYSMSLSPDGRWLAFGRSSNAAASGDLDMSFQVYDLVHGTTTQLGTFNYGSLNFGPRPVWSPNSGLLAYYAVVDEALQLKVWDLKQARNLPISIPLDKAGAAELQKPQWTPDTLYVMCLSNSVPAKRLWEEQEGNNYTARLRAELVGQRAASGGATLLGTSALAPTLRSIFGADITSASAGPPRTATRQIVAVNVKTAAMQVLAEGAEFVQLQISDDGKVALAGALDAQGNSLIYALPIPTGSARRATDLSVVPPVESPAVASADGTGLHLLFQSSDKEQFQNFNLSPTGHYAAYLVEGSGEIMLIDLKTGEKRNLTSNFPNLVPDTPSVELEKIAGRFDLPLYKGKFGISNGDAPVWTKDESTLLMRRVIAQPSVTEPQRVELWRVPRAGGTAERVIQDTALSIVSWADCGDRSRVNCVTGSDGAVLALLQRRRPRDDGAASVNYARINPTSGAVRILRQTSASKVDELKTASLTGDAVSVEESASRPQELWRVNAVSEGRDAKPVTQSLDVLNPAPLPAVGLTQRIEWTSKTGEQLFAVLRLPADLHNGDRLPVILDVYPGRQGLRNSRGFNPGRLEPLLTSAHFALLTPDMPVKFGSGHVCDDFARYATEALDAAIATGHVDGIRAGVMGISYGGYAVNCIVTHTDRFGAAVSEAGPSDLASSHALGGRGEWNVTKSWQWETPERIVDESPAYHLDKVRTPILLFAGKTDLNNALQEYEMYFGLLALKRPAALVSYDKAGHGDYDRFPDFWQRVNQWFETYLKAR